jgi:hypothetical protein
MRDVLRLRDRSLGTGKTYLIWFLNFRHFVGEKQPGEPHIGLRGYSLGPKFYGLVIDNFLKRADSDLPLFHQRP